MIKNRNYIQQVKDFGSLRFDTIQPTDIDGFIDFGNKIFFIIEVKYGNKMPGLGQRLAFERLCDACVRGGVTTFVIIAGHNKTFEEDIDVGNLFVSKYRYNGGWHSPKKEITVRDAISILRNEHNGN